MLSLDFKKVIKTQSLYLLFYLKKNRVEYYDRMSAIREAAENLSVNLSIAYNTVSSAVGRFEILGILSLVKKQGRNKVYSYEEYIDILRSGDEDEIIDAERH